MSCNHDPSHACRSIADLQRLTQREDVGLVLPPGGRCADVARGLKYEVGSFQPAEDDGEICNREVEMEGFFKPGCLTCHMLQVKCPVICWVVFALSNAAPDMVLLKNR